MSQDLGFVGLGLMGAPMAQRLLAKGYRVTVYNRTRAKAEPLLLAGALWAEAPAAVAQRASIVHSMISTPYALRDIAGGPAGILAGLKPGGIHIDHSTVSPEVTRQLAREYESAGKFFLHAPVLGSVTQAMEGSLLLFVGGAESAFKSAEPVLRALGSRIWRFAHVEQATTTKLLCNSFIAGMIGVLAQALVLAKRADVGPSTLLEIIHHSQLNAPMYQAKGKSIIERNFVPRFFVEHLLKDTNLVLDVARTMHVPMPVAEVMKDLIERAMKDGLGKEDYSAVVKVLEAEAGTEVR